MPRTRIAILLTGALLIALTAPAASAAKHRGSGPARASVVVAVADSGINPYHRAFYRPQNTMHPCTWVKGFTDCSVPALRLSVGGRDREAALNTDAKTLAAARPGQWYWIPRTNIIGAFCDPSAVAAPAAAAAGAGAPARCVLDDSFAGNGTGAASSVLNEAPDALLLVHDGDAAANGLAKPPVVPDLLVQSLTPAVSPPGPAASAGGEAVCPAALRRPETLVFAVAGYGAPQPSLRDCERPGADVQVVGAAYPGYWRYDTKTAYDFASWQCPPIARADSVHDHDAAGDACLQVSPTINQNGAYRRGDFSAATAAGAAAAALLRIREHDAYPGRSTAARVSKSVTTTAFVGALRSAATYAPKPKYPVLAGPDVCDYVACFLGWAPLPEQAPWLAWGYGWLDGTVADAVASCALRTTCPGKPDQANDYNEARQAVRHLAASR